MPSNFLVSIVIPIYRVEAYLRECVDSVIRQSYSNLEIILVDDASPDRCPMICDEYATKDDRVKVIHKPDNGGLSDARNVGLAAITGEYVYFLDSDDCIEEESIELLLSEAIRYSADVIFFDSIVFGDMTCSGMRENYYTRGELYSNPKTGIEMLRKLLKYNEYRSAVPLLFIRRQILSEFDMTFYNGIIYEDELFTFLLFLHSRTVVHLAEPLYKRRIRDNSITNSSVNPNNFKSILIVASEMINTCINIDVNSQDRIVIRLSIDYILRAVNRIYYQLSIAQRISLGHKLNEFKSLLRVNEYFGCKDIEQACVSIHTISIERVIRSNVPDWLKPLLRGVIRRLQRPAPQFPLVINQLSVTSGKPRIILLGTPAHGNLGDHAIAIAEKAFFADFLPDLEVVELVMPVYRAFSKQIRTYVHANDIVVVSGGGWLGSLWQHNEDTVRSIVCDYAENKIIILPQTVYFEDSDNGRRETEISQKIYTSHNDLLFCLRDKASYDFVLNNMFTQSPDKCLYLPDMVLYLNQFNHDTDRIGVLLCFRQDREKCISPKDKMMLKDWLWKRGKNVTFTTTVNLDPIPLQNRKRVLDSKLIEYASARMIVTDRLHSMLFAAITGTPCIAFNNVTGKVKGVHEWIKHLEYIRFVSTVDEAIVCANQLLKMDSCVYDNSALKEHFLSLLPHMKER